jgi:hypothetical protein
MFIRVCRALLFNALSSLGNRPGFRRHRTTASGRLLPVVTGSNRPRVCKNVFDQQHRKALGQTKFCVDARQTENHRTMGSSKTSARSFSKETLG